MIIINIIFKIIKKIYNIINKIIKFNNKIYDEKIKAMEYCGRLFLWLFIIMSTFTHQQLSEGVVNVSLVAPITAQFQNPSGSAYFVLEQNTGKDNSTGFFPQGTTSYSAGSFSSLNRISEIDIVENTFKFGIVVPEGSSSLVFSPNDTSGAGSITLKGTGMYTLIIT